MADELKVDICVIGAGSGGLSVAAGAAQMGARTVLIEKGKMGGDCLNYGCVPSKALLAAGHAAEAVRRGGRFGIDGGEPTIDSSGVYGHLRRTIAAIAPHDSVARFEGLGVTVIQAAARFTGPRTVEAGGRTVAARRFVLATGSSPLVPPIEGLAAVPFLTNETIFELDALPRHLIVVGGGPIGIEMAQAHRHLGAQVTVLEMASIMPRDDVELVDVVRARLAADGVEIREGVRVTGVERNGDGIAVTFDDDGNARRVEGSHLLIAAGRRANVDDLGLDEAGIVHTPKGVRVDARLRTTNRRVFAVGDVTGGYQFTHVAGHQAGVVIRNALLRLPARTDMRAVPWVTYTAPELAQVGLTEAEAAAQGMAVRILRHNYADNDRARAEAETDGLVKVVATPRGRILGAGIVGAHAGELIHTWVLALGRRMNLRAVADMIAPYPTLGEINKRAAAGFYTPSLFGRPMRTLVRLLSYFG